MCWSWHGRGHLRVASSALTGHDLVVLCPIFRFPGGSLSMPCVLRAFVLAILGGSLLAPTNAAAVNSVGTTVTYYHPSLHGSVMANGRPYNRWDPLIAASNWYPLGTTLKVTRQSSNNYIFVRVQDRGSRGLTIDLSEAGFSHLGGLGEGRIA